jgi:hypothetical protein
MRATTTTADRERGRTFAPRVTRDKRAPSPVARSGTRRVRCDNYHSAFPRRRLHCDTAGGRFQFQRDPRDTHGTEAQRSIKVAPAHRSMKPASHQHRADRQRTLHTRTIMHARTNQDGERRSAMSLSTRRWGRTGETV